MIAMQSIQRYCQLKKSGFFSVKSRILNLPFVLFRLQYQESPQDLLLD